VGRIGAIFFATVRELLSFFIVSLFVDNAQTLKRIETIAIAPFVEETTKGLFLLATISSRKFNNMTDGIIYGGAMV